MWDNQGDAQMRAAGTVVRYAGDAVYIKDVYTKMETANLHVKMLRLRDHKLLDKRLDSARWDWSPVPTGYVNHDHCGAVYVARMPIRKWKQGLHRDNCIISPDHGFDIVRTAEFANTVNGKYPSFKGALAKVKRGDVGGLAFHREWAIIKPRHEDTLVLYHRNIPVGVVRDGEPVLEVQKYLKESLAEAIA